MTKYAEFLEVYWTLDKIYRDKWDNEADGGDLDCYYIRPVQYEIAEALWGEQEFK